MRWISQIKPQENNLSFGGGFMTHPGVRDHNIIPVLMTVEGGREKVWQRQKWL